MIKRILLASAALVIVSNSIYAQFPKLDTKFGSGGKVDAVIGSFNKDVATGIAPTNDGKIVCVGHDRQTTSADKFIMARFSATGALDKTFNKTGYHALDLGGTRDFGFDCAVLPDNSILGVGFTVNATQNIVVVKFKPDGTLDPTFGVGGKSTIVFGNNDRGKSIIALPNGKILVGGTSAGSILAVKLNADGSLDKSWAGEGFSQITSSANVEVNKILLDPNGKIVFVGEIDNDGAANTSSTDFFWAKMNSEGIIDTDVTRIGDIGKYEVCYDAAYQSDGKLVMVGTKNKPSAVPTQIDTLTNMAVRLNVNGSIDKLFTRDFGINYAESFKTVKIMNNGKIICAGNVNFDNLIVRFNTDLTLDNSFGGPNGYSWSIAGSKDEVNRMFINNNFQLICAGYSTTQPGDNNYTLSKLNTEQTVNLLDQDENLVPLQVLPNPSNGVIRINYQLSSESNVRFEVYDLAGRLVHSFDAGEKTSDPQTEMIDLSHLNAGTYICRMVSRLGNSNIKIQLLEK
ncbi:MAG: T9SS type A sorting domain-containing protein [Saprospiraceae bacterium]